MAAKLKWHRVRTDHLAGIRFYESEPSGYMIEGHPDRVWILFEADTYECVMICTTDTYREAKAIAQEMEYDESETPV